MSQKLVSALKAGIPLIRVLSRDSLNDTYIVSSIAKKVLGTTPAVMHDYDAEKVTKKLGLSKPIEKKKVVILTSPQGSLKALYDAALEIPFILVLVLRSEKEVKEKSLQDAYDAGELSPIENHLTECVKGLVPDSSVQAIVSCLKGLQLKDVPTVLKLTSLRDQSITQEGVLKTRSEVLTGVRGVSTVDTSLFFYEVHESLHEWATLNKRVFWHCKIDRLIPRGVMFDGQAGTGKTLGAKYLANEFEVPLIQFDLGAMLGKYVGESEEHLSLALHTIELLAPCVVLMDEVEKVFASSGDSGTTQRLLSKILWWLQEHKSKIVTVMTTNDKSKLPEELYRAGRIDQVFTFTGLQSEKAIMTFLKELSNSWSEYELKQPFIDNMPEEIMAAWSDAASSDYRCPSHAFVVQFYEQALKQINF